MLVLGSKQTAQHRNIFKPTLWGTSNCDVSRASKMGSEVYCVTSTLMMIGFVSAIKKQSDWGKKGKLSHIW